MYVPKLYNGIKVERYNVASLAAAQRVMDHPVGKRCLHAAMVYGTTAIHVDIESTQKSLTDCAIAGYDMPVETNELVDEMPWQPINCMLKEGESLSILGSSLTLAAEVSLYVAWTKGRMGPEMRYSYHTYTAVATDVPAVLAPATFPDFAKTLKLAQTRGINLEATNFDIGGTETGWIDGRNCSALADIVVPAQWQQCDVAQIGGRTVTAKTSNVGATGTSDAIFGWTV